MDGGIRSGQDVLKAWALGARGTMIGRAMLYGLGAMGEAGVTKALQIIHKELDVTMAFCGHTASSKSTGASCCRGPSRPDKSPAPSLRRSYCNGSLTRVPKGSGRMPMPSSISSRASSGDVTPRMPRSGASW